MILNKNVYDKQSLKYKKLNEAVLNFIINTDQPISIIDNAHFIDMLRTFDDRFKPKCRQTITYTDIPEKLESIKKNMNKVRKLLLINNI